MEMVQFHPTGMVWPNGDGDSRKHLRKHIDRHHRITNSKIAAGCEKKRKKEKTLVVVPLNGIPLVLADWVGILRHLALSLSSLKLELLTFIGWDLNPWHLQEIPSV
jgi:hypothetical protein